MTSAVGDFSCGAIQRWPQHRRKNPSAAGSYEDAAMQRNALGVALALTLGLTPSARGQQIITAQPAQGFRPITPYSAGYQPDNSYNPTLASLVQSPEANTIRGWYRDYLGREAGSDLTALVNLLRGGMSPTDLQATILGSDEF